MMPAADSRQGELVVFAGPSFSGSVRRESAGVEWRGPAIAGDMLRLLPTPPRCVAIIDGLFDQAPAVRHKEILVLLSRGVHVLGGASMGALRAAELSPFGMIGVGQVYRAYKDGRLDRDDEVALLHGPEALDWAPFTIPLVNVRATLLSAARARVISCNEARNILNIAAAIFYKERTWVSVISQMRTCASDIAAELNRFTEWLPSGIVDIKRLDAEACLDIGLHLRHEPPLHRPSPPDTLFSQALARAVSVKPPLQNSV